MKSNRTAATRAKILDALRSNTAPFADATPRPDAYLPVTRVEGDLLERFTTELEKLTGKVHVLPDSESAIQCVIDILGEDKSALVWDDLPLPGLNEALIARGITPIMPNLRGDSRSDVLNQIEPVRVGITGADAALASTGTLALVTRTGHGRLVSLLPRVHVALLPRNRLYPNLESWLAEAGRAAMLETHNTVLITGPSRTSDIEMQTILGVHGPAQVHVVVF